MNTALVASLIGLWFALRYFSARRQLVRQREAHRLRGEFVRTYYHRRALTLLRKHEDADGGMKSAQVFPSEGAIDERRSCGVYRQSQEARAIKRLLTLKYGKVTRGEAALLAVQIAGYLAAQFAVTDWTPDVITCVPSTDARLMDRGFNQAELIARELALKLNIPYADRLQRATQTQAQAKIRKKDERLKNLEGAFAARCPNGERVLIVDDVATTGATLQECARALKASGAAKVWALTLASGVVERRTREERKYASSEG